MTLTDTCRPALLVYRERRMRPVANAKDNESRWRVDAKSPWSDPRTVVAEDNTVAELLVRCWNGKGMEIERLKVETMEREHITPGTLVWISAEAGYRSGE